MGLAYREILLDRQPKRCRIGAESLPKSVRSEELAREVSVAGAVELALPEPVGDALDAVGEVIAIGIEGEAE